MINQGHSAVPTSSSKLRQTVLDDLTRLGKARGLMSYEQVKNVAFIEEPFSLDNNLLTPTFKARRYAIEKKYMETFQELYRTLSSWTAYLRMLSFHEMLSYWRQSQIIDPAPKY